MLTRKILETRLMQYERELNACNDVIDIFKSMKDECESKCCYCYREGCEERSSRQYRSDVISKHQHDIDMLDGCIASILCLLALSDSEISKL